MFTIGKSARFGAVGRVAAAAALAACLTAPASASAQTWVFRLEQATNTPSPVTTTGSGFGVLTLTETSARVQVTWQDLVSPSTIAHFHCCTALPNAGTAGVASQLPSFPGFPGVAAPPGVVGGSYDRTFMLADFFNPGFIAASGPGGAGGTLADAQARFVTGLNEGRVYLNIHTVQYGSGEINGFASVVPEPSTYALFGAGLAGLGLVARGRRRAAARA